ncbi:MAG: DUF2334 domain-containing protein [Actinomycetota bacterium]
MRKRARAMVEVLVLIAAALAIVPFSSRTRTLILYDSTGSYGWQGELNAQYVANLASYFGSWTAMPVLRYRAGMMRGYSAVVYMGTTYDESEPPEHDLIPSSFLEDVLATSTGVIWLGENIWDLSSDPYAQRFRERYGWTEPLFDPSSPTIVTYKGTVLTRAAQNDPIVGYTVVDPSKITVLAHAVRADGTTFPWASRSANLTYVGEVPFSYTTETDRQLIFADLLFDALAPKTSQRHRAILRLEDVSPASDPDDLLALAGFLRSSHTPFGFGVIPIFTDPLGTTNGAAVTVRLRDRPKVVEAIRALIGAGGVMIDHGYTHQYGTIANPYDGMTGNDDEFYRVVENPDHTLRFVGPVPGDSPAWVNARLDAAAREFLAAGLPVPGIFEFPHYAASATDYAAVAARPFVRWEQSLYFAGLLDGKPDYAHMTGQMFPYAVTDVYGSKVLPENLGGYAPVPFQQYPAHTVADILAAARANLVVRDGVAGVYYHSYFATDALEQIVDGIRALGYRFVDARSL